MRLWTIYPCLMPYSTKDCDASLLFQCRYHDMFPRAVAVSMAFFCLKELWLVVRPCRSTESTILYFPNLINSTRKDGWKLKETPTDDDTSGLSQVEVGDVLESSKWPFVTITRMPT